MKIKSLTLLIAVATCSTSGIFAASSTYRLVNTVGANAILDASGTALDSGTPDTQNGNGFVFQLGYFSMSTAAFTGDWMPIAGFDSTNPTLTLNIGDFDAQNGLINVPDGLYSTTITFDDSNSTHIGLPLADTQLAIRYYDGTSPATDNFNTVTRSGWTFSPIADTPPINDDLDLASTTQGTIVWEDNANAFKTSIASVPEPSSFALLGLGAAAMIFRRKK